MNQNPTYVKPPTTHHGQCGHLLQQAKSAIPENQHEGICVETGGTADEEHLPDTPYPQLNPDALYGPLGEIVQKLEPVTEADPAAMLIQLLVAFGNAVGRSAYFYAGDQRHFTNMFACIVGRTAKARKGSSLSAVCGVMGRTDPTWNRACVTSGLSSGEGLIWAVRDPIVKIDKVGKTVTDDAGISDKRLLVSETEFGNAFAVLNRDSNTLSSILRLAWDTGNLRTLTKNSPALATGAHVSIIGHITKVELRRRMSEADFFNGFGNRFLWTCAQRSKILPESEGIEGAGLGDLITKLHQAVAFGRQVGEMEREPAASELWNHQVPTRPGW